MTNWEEFNSDDLWQIRRKINFKYERALIFTLALSIPLFFVSPYIPGRRSAPLIETLSYWDAVLRFMIFWVICLIFAAIYNVIRARKEYERIRNHLKVKTQSDVIGGISTPLLDFTYGRIYFNSIGKFTVGKELLDNLEPGNNAEIRTEVNSGAVLSLKKLPLT
jgi:hypothetical protein